MFTIVPRAFFLGLTLVWGIFDKNDLDLNQAKNFTTAALPMQQGVPVSRITTLAVPNGTVISLRFRAAGVTLKQQAQR